MMKFITAWKLIQSFSDFWCNAMRYFVLTASKNCSSGNKKHKKSNANSHKIITWLEAAGGERGVGVGWWLSLLFSQLEDKPKRTDLISGLEHDCIEELYKYNEAICFDVIQYHTDEVIQKWQKQAQSFHTTVKLTIHPLSIPLICWWCWWCWWWWGQSELTLGRDARLHPGQIAQELFP